MFNSTYSGKNTNLNYIEMLFLNYQIGKNLKKKKKKSLLARLWRSRHSHTEFLRELADSRAEAEKVCNEKHSTCTRKNMFKERRRCVKRHRRRLEETPTGQIWDNFSIKIRNNNKLRLISESMNMH